MRYRVPRRLGHVLEETPQGPVLYLCPLPHGPTTAVSGSGAIIWISAIADGEDVPTTVASAFDIDVESIREDVEGYLAYLVGEGLLEVSP